MLECLSLKKAPRPKSAILTASLSREANNKFSGFLSLCMVPTTCSFSLPPGLVPNTSAKSGSSSTRQSSVQNSPVPQCHFHKRDRTTANVSPEHIASLWHQLPSQNGQACPVISSDFAHVDRSCGSLCGRRHALTTLQLRFIWTPCRTARWLAGNCRSSADSSDM